MKSFRKFNNNLNDLSAHNLSLHLSIVKASAFRIAKPSLHISIAGLNKTDQGNFP
jgi:hypothetical protein